MTYISDRLVEMKTSIPKEFARKTRTLDELSRFKATELRLLLLYVLPIVLAEGDFPKEVYDHFLLLHCAIRTLSSPNLVRNKDNVEQAKQWLILFVANCSSLYRDQFISINVHNLIHLPAEVLLFGALIFFSCFPFEDRLQKLTNLIKRCKDPLPQLVSRLLEMRANPFPPIISPVSVFGFQLVKEHVHGPMIRQVYGNQFEGINLPNFSFSIFAPDNCAILSSGEHIKIENFVRTRNNEIFVICRQYLTLENLYDYPLSSRQLGMSVVSNISAQLMAINVKLIRFKGILVKSFYHNSQVEKIVVASILHE